MSPYPPTPPPTAAGSRFHKAKRTRRGPQDPYHCAASESNELIVNLLPISVAHADFHSQTTTMLPADFQPPLCRCGKQKVQLPKHQPFGNFHRTLRFSSAGLNHVANRQSAAKPPIPPASLQAIHPRKYRIPSRQTRMCRWSQLLYCPVPGYMR